VVLEIFVWVAVLNCGHAVGSCSGPVRDNFGYESVGLVKNEHP
jgi:hypothetical protein